MNLTKLSWDAYKNGIRNSYYLCSYNKYKDDNKEKEIDETNFRVASCNTACLLYISSK